jgi:beta-1,4-N-acetylglucosaminyltransferase
MTSIPQARLEVPSNPSKVCFVTIGATASFDKLLKAVLDRSFLNALQDTNYTELVIQYGKEGGKAIYDSFVATERDCAKQKNGIEITGFDFNANGLGQEMRKAKGKPGSDCKEGLVISHAGQTLTAFPGWK